MQMNIFKHEFNAKLRSVVNWSLSIYTLILVFMSLFLGFSSDSAMVTQIMKNYPREMLIAFGMADNDFSTILGFFGIVFLFCQICLAIQAANYGFSLVSVEETEWTADFLLSKPVGRKQIMTGKLMAALAALAITEVFVWMSSFLFVIIFRGEQLIPLAPMLLLMLSIPIFQSFFLSVGMLISLLVKRIRSVTPFSMALVFGLYILNAFGGMIGDQSLEILSPFQHFAPSYIIKNSSWNYPLVIISVIITIISVSGSFMLYQKRNIASAV
jgi:ABC-2 type transport system permease protein